MENKNDQAEVSTQQEEEVLETSNEQESEEIVQGEGETVEELKERLQKAEQLANNQKIRAEKAERLNKVAPKESIQVKSGDLSTKDLYALMDAKVPQDDVEEVRDYAKLKGISIPEALNTSFVKSLLSENAEKRNVAQASNTGVTRRSSKLSDEDLLESVRSGKASKLSDDDIARLAKIRV